MLRLSSYLLSPDYLVRKLAIKKVLPFRQWLIPVASIHRLQTYGYGSYCLSGKGKHVIWRTNIYFFDQYVYFFRIFRLEKPNFHNRRIYSAEKTNHHQPAWKAEQFICKEPNPQQVAIRYSAVGCNDVKKYRISFIQFVLIWIELSFYRKFPSIHYFK